MKDLFLSIMGKSKPEKMSDDEWEIHLKVAATIRQLVDVNNFHHISKNVNADEP